MSLEFSRPLFLIIIPVLVAFVILVSGKLKNSYNKARKWGQIVLRCILFTLIGVALAGPSLKLTSNRVTTIFLVDVSDSVREQREETVKFVSKAIAEKKSNDYVGVIAFGSDRQVEQFVSNQAVFNEIQTDVNCTATNVEEAIKMAIGLMPEDSAKRIVLITDGNENEGSMKNTTSAIAASGITVLTKVLEENTSEEVYVSEIKMPENVGTGETFNINVEVESNTATKAIVSLYMGRTLKGRQEVTLQKGTNHYVFSDTQSDEGIKTYQVTVEAEADTVTVNNEYAAYTNCEIEQPILIVEGVRGDGEMIETILDSLNIRSERVVAQAAPATLSEMSNYSAIIFADVYADDLRAGFVDNIETYIKNGGGFVTTGGPNSYALGEYKGTAIEDVLPVNMDLVGEQVVPKLAIAMVIDRSGSMSDGNGQITMLDLAKNAAVAALDNVRDSDRVGVLTFDDGFNWVCPMTDGSERDNVEDRIDSVGIGGGTSILPALREAAIQVSKEDAMIKHIILLTDGEDGYDFSNYKNILESINNEGITVSTVAMGSGCNTALLQALADACNGRMYSADIDDDLPRIFAQEVYLSSQSYIRNEEFLPSVTDPNSDLLSGVIGQSVSTLQGYVATTPKNNPQVKVILESPEGDPILASRGNIGGGRSVAWMSDFTGRWSANWSSGEYTQKLWSNIISYVTGGVTSSDAYAEIEQEGRSASINYTTKDFDSSTTVVATITDDHGNTKEVELVPDEPGHYVTDFDMDSTGVYSINIKEYAGEEIRNNLNTAAIMQYSVEYQFMKAVNSVNGFVASVGGKLILEPEEVFADKLELIKSKTDITLWLLAISIFLFLADIAVRRFHINLGAPFEKAKERSRIRKEQQKARQDAKEKAVLLAGNGATATVDTGKMKSASAKTAAGTHDSLEAQPAAGSSQTNSSDPLDKKAAKAAAKASKAAAAEAAKAAKKKANEPKMLDTKALLQKRDDDRFF